MKGTKLYLVLIAVISYVLVNVPLLLVLKNFSYDRDLAWKVLRNSPHQFLFLFFFFPIGLICLIRAGRSIINLMQSKRAEEVPFLIKRFPLIYFSFNLVFLLIAIAFTSLTKTQSTSDIYKLKPDYAEGAILAKEIVFQEVLKEDRYRSSWKDQFKLLPGITDQEWADLEKAHVHEGFSSAKFFHDIASTTYENLEKSRVGNSYWNDLLSANNISRLKPKDLHESTLFLQFIYDSELLFQIEKESGKRVLSRAVLGSSFAEFVGSSFILLHFFLFSVTAIYLQTLNKVFSADDLRRPMSLLFAALSIFCMWFSLRIYSVNEVQILYGGDNGTSLQLLSGFVFMVGIAIYLLYPTFNNSISKLLLELSPIILAIIPTMFTLFNPTLASKILGSSADFSVVLMLLISYLVLIAPWLYLNIKKRAG